MTVRNRITVTFWTDEALPDEVLGELGERMQRKLDLLEQDGGLETLREPIESPRESSEVSFDRAGPGRPRQSNG